ncbi:hypothetical protein LPJ72_005582 [Coemansia sp. Benny D160-2]|nr:hypothetical protein LPJ72_005582 [Coemansia sp. Benny D160-2]
MSPSVIAAHGPSDSDVHKQHAASTGAVAKLISEELDNALSPLSSSTITIASLGSSLGLANVGGKLGGSHARGYDMAGVATDREEGPESSSSSVRSSRTTSPRMAATDDSGSSTEAAADTESSPSVKAVGGDDDTYSRRGTVEAAEAAAELPALPASSRIISAKQKKASPAMRSISMDYTHAYASSIQASPSSSSSSPPLQLPLPLPLGAPAFSSGNEVGRETADEAKSQPDEAAPSPPEESRTFFAQRLLGPLSKRKSVVLLLGIDSKKKDKKKQQHVVVAAGESKAEAKAKAETDSKNKREAGDDDGEAPTTTAAASAAGAEAETEMEGVTANSSPSQPKQKHKSKPKQQAQRSMPSKSLDLGRELLSQARGPFNRRAMQRTKGENAIYAGKGDAAGTAAAPTLAMGPARFQELPRSLAARLGFSSTLASKARRAGDLRFVITPHATLPEVVEVIDCEEMVPVYRKISRSGKSWHETFHEVDVEAEENEMARISGALGIYGAAVDFDDPNMMSEYDMAMALGLPYPGIANYYGSVSSNASSRPGSLRNSVPFGSAMPAAANTASMYYSASAGGALSMAAPRGMAASASGAALSGHLGASASCATFHTMADDSESSSGGGGRRSEMPMALSNPSTASFANGGTVRMGRASTSIGMLGGMLGSMSMYGYGSGSQAQHPLLSPAMRQQGLLWEALTPYPNQFPLHIKDSRRVIDTASLASLVLDRQNFCYRFQLGSTRMRWAAKRVKKSQLALECYVRGVLVAEIFVDYEKGYSPYNMPAKSANRKQKQKQGPPESRIDDGSGTSTPYSRTASDASGNNYIYNGADGSSNDGSSRSNVPEDGTYPMMTILSSAFTHLAALDEDIVESFIVFSGIQVLEFLHL